MSISPARALLGALLTLFLALPATAQEAEAPAQPAGPPDGFEDAMGDALADVGEADGLMRCAGLFRSMRLFAGDETEVGQMAAERESDMAVFSIMVWQSEMGEDDMDVAFEAVLPVVEIVTALFQRRMTVNQDGHGSVFDDDLMGNMRYCNGLREDLLSETGG